jgi:hypothetical protein
MTDKHHIERGARRCIVRSCHWESLAVINSADTPNHESGVIRWRGSLETMSRLMEAEGSIVVVN